MAEKEKPSENEKLIGCTVLYKKDDGTILSATITSLSPSGDFLHSSDGNIWIDPEQIVETLHDPNAPPPEPEEEVKPAPPVRQETNESRTAKGSTAKKK